MAKEGSGLEKLARNVERLNRIISGDVAYFSFGFGECGYKSQCFGRKSIPGKIENWHAYTNLGRADLSEPVDEHVPSELKVEQIARLVNADFYHSDSSPGREWKFNPVFLTLALTGKHAQKGQWHLFYDIRETGRPVFDWEMPRNERVDYVSLKSSLFVLPGIANLKRFFDARREIMEKEPEFITEEEWHQESERDHARKFERKVRNPKKTDPSKLDIFDKFGYPPVVKELAGGFSSSSPELPIESEMVESIRKISENSQLVLPFGS